MAVAALALVDSLSSPDGPTGAPEGAAATAISAQRLADAASWDVLRAAAAALPWFEGRHEAAGAALLASAGSLSALAGADEGQLMALCGGDSRLAAELWEFFGPNEEDAAAAESSQAIGL